MDNESSKPVSPPQPGGKTPAAAAPPVAAAPAVQPVVVAAPAAQSVPLFGGHRGGGKKRADGLPAGSPEAIAADKEKNRLRMAQKRAETKVSPLPPALPGGGAPGQNAPTPVAAQREFYRLQPGKRGRTGGAAVLELFNFDFRQIIEVVLVASQYLARAGLFGGNGMKIIMDSAAPNPF